MEPAKAEVSDAPVEKKPDPVLDEKARREARLKHSY